MRKRNPTVRGQAEVIFLYDRILRLDPDRHAGSPRRPRGVLEARSLLRRGHARRGAPQDLPDRVRAVAATRCRTGGVARNCPRPASPTKSARLRPRRGSRLPATRSARLAKHEQPGRRTRRTRSNGQGATAKRGRAPDPRQVRSLHGGRIGCVRKATSKRAAAHLHRVLELDPEHAEASLMLADLYQRERNIPAAHALLRDAVALYPRDLRMVRSLSWLELIRGQRTGRDRGSRRRTESHARRFRPADPARGPARATRRHDPHRRDPPAARNAQGAGDPR